MGATEAIAATLLALCEPGDEVVMFEPSYDSYAACASMAGAVPTLVRLHPPDWSFDRDELARACASPRATMVLLNTPHNPVGKVFSPDELAQVAALVAAHDLLAVTDEVYEHLVFEGTHVPLATLPDMGGRTLTISSGGKTFSFTRWKSGLGPAAPADSSPPCGRPSSSSRTPARPPSSSPSPPGWPSRRRRAAARQPPTWPAKRGDLCDGLGPTWASQWCTAPPPPT